MSDTGLHAQMGDLRWRIHMPNLLQEIMNNPGTGMLAKPLTILGHKLHDLAELAIEIDDPRLHLLMMDLTLYEIGDPHETSMEDIEEARCKLMDAIAEMESV